MENIFVSRNYVVSAYLVANPNHIVKIPVGLNAFHLVRYDNASGRFMHMYTDREELGWREFIGAKVAFDNGLYDVLNHTESEDLPY